MWFSRVEIHRWRLGSAVDMVAVAGGLWSIVAGRDVPHTVLVTST